MKKLYWLLGVALIGFLPIRGIDLRAGKEIITSWVCIALIASVFIKNKWLKVGVYWLLFRTIYSALQAGYALAWPAMVTILFYVLFYEVVVEKGKIRSLLNAICIITLIQSLFMLLQWSGIWPFFYPTDYPNARTIWHNSITITKPFFPIITGFTCNFDMAGSFVALGIPAFFRKGWHWFLPILILALFIAGRLGGLIPGMIAIGAYVVIKFRYVKVQAYIVILVILMSGLSLMALPQNKINFAIDKVSSFSEYVINKTFHDHRYDIYKSVVQKIIPIRPIVGWGLNQSQVLYPAIQKRFFPKVTGGIYKYLHNEYLQAWVEGGIILIIIILGFIFSLFKKLIYVTKYSKYVLLLSLGIFVGLVNAGVNFLFHTPYCLIWLVYAAIIQQEYNRVRREHGISH